MELLDSKMFPTTVLKVVYLDGKMITYDEDSEFVVQVGKGTKGKYETSYRFYGNIHQAVHYYKAINIGNGYKKRLLMPTRNTHKVLARMTS